MSETKHYVTLNADQVGPVEVKVGSIYVSAKPGEIVEVNFKQLNAALISGRFVKAAAPKATKAETKETPASKK